MLRSTAKSFRPGFDCLESRENTSTLGMGGAALPVMKPATQEALVHEETHSTQPTSYRGHTVPLSIIAILIG